MPKPSLLPRLPASLRFLLLATFVASAVAALDAGFRAWDAERSEPARGAAWIWADGIHRSAKPTAFWAVREVDLPSPEKVWVEIAADESYVLWFNGRRIGSRALRDPVGEMPVDRYEIGRAAREGVNRIAVELSSASGAGGLLATVRQGTLDQVVVRSDETWRIYRAEPEGIFGDAPLPSGEPAKVWRRAPTGHWRLAPAQDRPIWKRDKRPPRAARRVRFDDPNARWLKVSSPRFRVEPDSYLVYDWGRQVCGYLTFEISPNTADGPEAGLLDVSLEEPRGEAPVPAAAIVLPIPGGKFWRDPEPRCLRYARLRGVLPRGAPTMELLPTRLFKSLSHERTSLTGVFGLLPPQPDTPEEDAVRRRLDDFVRENH